MPHAGRRGGLDAPGDDRSRRAGGPCRVAMGAHCRSARKRHPGGRASPAHPWRAPRRWVSGGPTVGARTARRATSDPRPSRASQRRSRRGWPLRRRRRRRGRASTHRRILRSNADPAVGEAPGGARRRAAGACAQGCRASSRGPARVSRREPARGFGATEPCAAPPRQRAIHRSRGRGAVGLRARRGHAGKPRRRRPVHRPNHALRCRGHASSSISPDRRLGGDAVARSGPARKRGGRHRSGGRAARGCLALLASAMGSAGRFRSAPGATTLA